MTEQSDMQNSTHYEKDVLPFQWCCVDSKNHSTDYCNMYLNKRPMAKSDKYDQLSLGN